MQTFAHYALPAAIVASALGAVVFCIVLLLYGFASAADDEPRFPGRRLFVIRIGHALAATCFAAVVILTTVAFLDERRAVVLPESGAPRSSDEQALEARMSALEQRLEAAEKRSGDVREQPATVQSPMTPAPPAVHRAVTPRRPALPDRPRRSSPEEVAALPPRGAGESPIGGAALGSATPPSPTQQSSSVDVRTKVRSDWEIVKRGFRDAGHDIQSGFSDLSRRVKRSFGSDTH